MSDLALAALVGNAVLAAAIIWWWARYGRHEDRWRVPVGGVAVALVIILIALVSERLIGP
jgi:hypothetical protein